MRGWKGVRHLGDPRPTDVVEIIYGSDSAIEDHLDVDDESNGN